MSAASSSPAPRPPCMWTLAYGLIRRQSDPACRRCQMLLRGMNWNHVEAIPTLVPQPCCYPPVLQSWESTSPGEIICPTRRPPDALCFLAPRPSDLERPRAFAFQPARPAPQSSAAKSPISIGSWSASFKQPWSPTGRCVGRAIRYAERPN